MGIIGIELDRLREFPGLDHRPQPGVAATGPPQYLVPGATGWQNDEKRAQEINKRKKVPGKKKGDSSSVDEHAACDCKNEEAQAADAQLRIWKAMMDRAPVVFCGNIPVQTQTLQQTGCDSQRMEGDVFNCPVSGS